MRYVDTPTVHLTAPLSSAGALLPHIFFYPSCVGRHWHAFWPGTTQFSNSSCTVTERH